MTGDIEADKPESMPATPSEETERPAGLAFDVEDGADLSGVPVGDQTPENAGAVHIDEAVRERGGGPPAGLDVPGDQRTASSTDDGGQR